MIKAEALRSSIRSLIERPLSDRDLFVSEDSYVLKPFGAKILRSCLNENYLHEVFGQDPSVNGNPTPARLKELEREVEEGCAELEIARRELPLAREQMLGVLEAKEQRLREEYPLLKNV